MNVLRSVKRYWEKELAIEKALVEIVNRRGSGKTACPSEVARTVFSEHWREEMENVRRVARKLAQRGEIVVTQRAKRLDPDSSWKGAIRIGLPSEMKET